MSSNFYYESSDYLFLDRELRRLKVEVLNIKNENTELINMLTTITVTMKQMAKQHDVKLKTKNEEIASLKQKLEQSEKNHFQTTVENYAGKGHGIIETETIKPIRSEVKVEIYNSSFSSIQNNNSFKQPQLLDNNNSKISNNTKINPVDTQKNISPNIEKRNVVTTIKKDYLPSNVQRRKEVPYSSDLEVINGWTFLHLYNVKSGTHENVILKYVQSLSGYAVCTVVALKALGEYASFKIGVPAEFADKILKTENWTGNIRIRPWKQNVPARKVVTNTNGDNSKSGEKQ